MSGAGLAKLPTHFSKKPFEPFLFRVISLDCLGRYVLNIFPSMATKYIELLEGPVVCLLGIKGNYLLETIRTSLDTVECYLIA